jgi:hypothetical protein
MESGISGQSRFIFATLDGTISAGSPVVDGATGLSHANLVLIDRARVRSIRAWPSRPTKQALSCMTADGGPNRRVDMFDRTFHLVKSFDDPDIPKRFTPYGIQTVNGDIGTG